MTVPDPTTKQTCDLVTRRQFVKGLGATVAVVTAAGYGIAIWGRNPAALAAAAPPSLAFGTPVAGRTLVVIEMGGGNDGMNMVVPHGSDRYYDLRRDVAVTDPLDLDGEIGLHPAMPLLAARYRRGQVAVVEGIGYPDPDLSHFSSMSTWWTGNPGSFEGTGWLGRMLDGTAGRENPLAAITIGPGPSPAMLGEASFVVSIQDSSGLAPDLPPWIDTPDELLSSWAGFAESPVDSPTLFGQVQRAIAATTAAQGQLKDALEGGAERPGGDRSRRRRGDLTDSLDVAARLITSDIAPSVVYVHGFGDFDTHQGQVGRHAALMGQLDTAVGSFFDELEAASAAERAIVMTTSEFGRRAAANGSGTDHGTAATHLLIGPSVAGGRHGESPDLAKLDSRGNLIHTVDYRSLYAGVLDGWLGVEHPQVLGAEYETLRFIRRTRASRIPKML